MRTSCAFREPRAPGPAASCLLHRCLLALPFVPYHEGQRHGYDLGVLQRPRGLPRAAHRGRRQPHDQRRCTWPTGCAVAGGRGCRAGAAGAGLRKGGMAGHRGVCGCWFRGLSRRRSPCVVCCVVAACVVVLSPQKNLTALEWADRRKQNQWEQCVKLLKAWVPLPPSWVPRPPQHPAY